MSVKIFFSFFKATILSVSRLYVYRLPWKKPKLVWLFQKMFTKFKSNYYRIEILPSLGSVIRTHTVHLWIHLFIVYFFWWDFFIPNMHVLVNFLISRSILNIRSMLLQLFMLKALAAINKIAVKLKNHYRVGLWGLNSF